MKGSLALKPPYLRDSKVRFLNETAAAPATDRRISSPTFKETEHLRSYKLRIASLERELAEKTKTIERLRARSDHFLGSPPREEESAGLKDQLKEKEDQIAALQRKVRLVLSSLCSWMRHTKRSKHISADSSRAARSST